MKIILSNSTDPPFNLATEEYLFASNNEEYLFLYINEPCVIVGSNQAVINEVDEVYCLNNNISIIRRISGGGAVFHDLGNINFSFINNRCDEPLSAKFISPILDVLRGLGIPVYLGKRKDLWLMNGKVSGTASHISKGRELHHGTLLYETNIETLKKALNPKNRFVVTKATQSVVSPVRNISDFVKDEKGQNWNVESFIKSLIEALLDYYDLKEQSCLIPDERRAIEDLYLSRYMDTNWNYRK